MGWQAGQGDELHQVGLGQELGMSGRDQGGGWGQEVQEGVWGQVEQNGGLVQGRGVCQQPVVVGTGLSSGFRNNFLLRCPETLMRGNKTSPEGFREF